MLLKDLGPKIPITASFSTSHVVRIAVKGSCGGNGLGRGANFVSSFILPFANSMARSKAFWLSSISSSSKRPAEKSVERN